MKKIIKLMMMCLFFATSIFLIFAEDSRPNYVWELAYLANDTYNNYCSPENIENLIAEDVEFGQNDFQAVKYGNDTTIVISYRGTDELLDYFADAGLYYGPLKYKEIFVEYLGERAIDSQISQALNFYNKCMRNEYREVIIIGHSLGGFLAQIVGAHSGKETHTFNAPGADEFVSYLRHTGNIFGLRGNVTNHLSEEWISELGEHFGKVQKYLHESHSIESFYKYLKRYGY